VKNTLLGLIMVIAISSGVALAQRPRHEDFGRDPQGRRPTRIDFLARRLDLTDPQKQQATSIFNAAEEASKKFRESLEQAQSALNDAVKTGVSDQQIEKLAGALGTLAGQLAANETKARAKFRALLTAEQRQEFDQLPGPGAGMRMRGFGGGPPQGPGTGMMMRDFAGPWCCCPSAGPWRPGIDMMMPGFGGGRPPGPHGWNPPPPAPLGPPPSSEDAPD
jgi:Spy/CpxP family protein refolding chaperone